MLSPVLMAARGVKIASGGLGFGDPVHAAGSVAAPRQSAAAPGLSRRNEISAILHKVNSYQLAHPVQDPREAADPLWHPWPRTVWYHGVMAAWRATRDPAYLEQALAYGRQLEWQVGKERMGPNRLWPIQLWAEIYFAKRDRTMIEPSIQWLATPDPLSPGGSKQWYLDARNTKAPPIPLADSLYGAPALAMLAKATGDKQYIEIMNEFFDGTTAALFDKEAGLYYRDPTYIEQRTKNGKKILWSRGNGWVFAGIPRILDYLPKHDPSRERYLEVFRRMAPEIVKRQGADGLWRMNLDDAEEFPDPETSGSGFFCYGLAWGINHGILDRKEYLPALQKSWVGLTESISPEGKILWGQRVDAEPNATPRESTHEYVTGAFMLAASEIYRMAH